VQIELEALGDSVDPFGDSPQGDCERFRDVSELQVLLCTARGANSGRRD
jgi:hypothetical protein